MSQPAPKNNKKTTSDSYEVTSGNLFNPEIFDRIIRKQKIASGLDKFCTVFLYILLVLCVLIGAVGIVLCIVYFNTSSNSQGWKIGGIILGAITCIIGIILIIITIFKQNDKRPWRYEKGKNNFYANVYRKNDEKDNRLTIENFDEQGAKNHMMIQQNPSGNGKMGSQSVIMQPSSDRKTRQPVLAQRSNSVIEPSKLKTGNDFQRQIQPTLQTLRQDLISFSTDDDEKAKINRRTFTAIDRPMNNSTSFSIQNGVKIKSGPNRKEIVVARRVRQATTKVVIVKVPNVAGQLVMQPKTERTDK